MSNKFASTESRLDRLERIIAIQQRAIDVLGTSAQALQAAVEGVIGVLEGDQQQGQQAAPRTSLN